MQAALGSPAGPQRIVSINLCADQLVLALAERERIASVSEVALDPTVSNVVVRARGLVTNSGRLEEIVRLRQNAESVAAALEEIVDKVENEEAAFIIDKSVEVLRKGGRE